MTVSVTAVNVGTAPADGTGDPARTAFTKLNANDTALASAINALGSGGGGFNYVDTVPDYASLPTGLGTGDKDNGWVVAADGLVYVWDGSAFPANGSGAPFQGPPGQTGDPGPVGVGVPGPTGPAGSSNIPINVQSGTTYTAVAADAGGEIDMTSSSANTVNIPASTFNPGDLQMIRSVGTGATKVQGSGGMNLLSASGATVTLSQYQSCGILHASATTAYLDTGSGASVAFALVGTLPAGSVGVAYSATLALSGTYTLPVTVTIPTGSMPSWMSKSITGSTITFSGMPDASATTAFTVRGTDSSATPLVANSAQSVAIVASATFTIAGTLPGGQVGVPYSASLTFGGSYNTPVVIDASSGAIPAWMTVTVSGTGATFTGTPTTAETEAFTVRATDSSGTARVATVAQSIVIAAAPPAATVLQKAVSTTTAAASSRAATLASAPTAGNLLVAIVTYSSSISVTSVPTGWTLWTLGVVGLGNARGAVYTRLAQAGDGATYTWTFSGSQYESVLLYEVVTTSGTISSQGRTAAGTQYFPISVSTAAEAGNGLAIVFGASQDSQAITASAGWTASQNSNTVGYATYAFKQKTVSTAGSTATLSSSSALSTGAAIVVIGA
jgi:hypothetical protein